MVPCFRETTQCDSNYALSQGLVVGCRRCMTYGSVGTITQEWTSNKSKTQVHLRDVFAGSSLSDVSERHPARHLYCASLRQPAQVLWNLSVVSLKRHMKGLPDLVCRLPKRRLAGKVIHLGMTCDQTMPQGSQILKTRVRP